MGVAVSGWRLARAVSRAGHLGVVSGTAMDAVLARVLQDGDPGGHYRRALAAFPHRDLAERVLATYFVDGGRPSGTPYRPVPKIGLRPSRAGQELAVLGTFTEVWLAREGHDGVVGVNCLEKIQLATPAAVLGAMLAGVDHVLMGAGIPREVPQLLRSLAAGRVGRLTVDVAGSTRAHHVEVDPAALLGEHLPALERPRFLAIVSLDQLASYLHRDPDIRPDGFVVERPPAGGHSAPPRGRMQLDEHGAPVYGVRDEADLAKVAALGLPFWVAGATGSPDGLAAAREAGAEGIQVGTVFALCAESGLTDAVRRDLLGRLAAGDLVVRNDPRASPTGFPFKVVDLPGTASDPAVAADRPRLCDLSYLRQPYERPDGSVGFRCGAEPVAMFLRKGGTLEETEGRRCLCNGLTATVGLGQQRRDGYAEPPLVTLGEDLAGARELLRRHPDGWTAAQALDFLTEDGR
ncbi:nitronate monooxygenase [Phycicoccus sp. MQZ13P-5]|uniref:Nitronate monooxygenase n=2 Tax=Phycicoccus sonneratiae TaxID=2807628 RepID=A0ABS2CJ96_9MICO|nr:nitronate monooxygenase [Phycicoccus sonneraticus]